MAKPPPPSRALPAILSRWRLLLSAVAGIAAAAGLSWSGWVDAPTAWILGWIVLCLIFLGLILPFMAGESIASIKRHAATHDEGSHVIPLLAVLAALFSIAGVAVELAAAKSAKGAEEYWRVGLVIATVAVSWTFVQFVFALHYAHQFYGTDKIAGGQRGGLKFPGREAPDYWDFLHFSMIIGVANQTADIAFTSKPLRRTGTVHGVVAFVFNTAVLALTINLLAGLLG